MTRDWRNEKDYEYMDHHTPELWAWEFLRRNPEYRKDWENTLKAWTERSSSERYYWRELFGVKDNVLPPIPETLSFSGARTKWKLGTEEIINPSIDKPSFEYPFPLFHTYGDYYGKDELDLLPTLRDTEVLAFFDLEKPVQQQLEHFKALLEEEQNELKAYSGLKVQTASNKSIYWKDYIRILDAYENNTEIKEIAAVIYPNKENVDPAYHGSRSVGDSYEAAIKIRDNNYYKILQKPSEWKKR